MRKGLAADLKEGKGAYANAIVGDVELKLEP
jgi:hypothetical protein